jgi:hypothetical protein
VQELEIRVNIKIDTVQDLCQPLGLSLGPAFEIDFPVESREAAGLIFSAFSTAGGCGVLLAKLPPGAALDWLNAGDLLCVVLGGNSGMLEVTGILDLWAGV